MFNRDDRSITDIMSNWLGYVIVYFALDVAVLQYGAKTLYSGGNFQPLRFLIYLVAVVVLSFFITGAIEVVCWFSEMFFRELSGKKTMMLVLSIILAYTLISVLLGSSSI